MRDKPDTTASDFLASMFGDAEGNVFVCALPNARGGHPEYPLATRDRLSIEGLRSRRDRPGSAVYFCVGTLRPGVMPAAPGRSIRCKENVARIVTLQADTDLKSVTLSREEIEARLRGLEMPPSVLVWSGRGWHAYWLLNEAVQATPETVALVEGLNAQLADVVGGDAVGDVCRLMRLPGSHNTKDGAWHAVEVAHARWQPRYELSDLEEWLARQSPVIRRVSGERSERGSTSQQALRNVFERIADDHNFKIPMDADARLAAMSYQGAGDASIHNTQLAVTASLLTAGENLDDVVEIVLAATRAAAGADGANWNWTREERAIRRMGEDWLRKHPEIVRKVDSRKVDSARKAQIKQMDRGDSLSQEAEGIREGSTGAVIHRLADERAKREKAPPKDRAKNKAAAPVVVADGVVDALRQMGCDFALTEGEMWLYEAGVWIIVTPAEEQWLRTLIQTGCDTLGYSGDSKVANGAWKRLAEHPDLHRRKVDWDPGGLIATTNGLLDLSTRVLTPYRADAWCRSKIGQPFAPGAECPVWCRFLDGCFANLPQPEREAVVAALQEAFGAFLATKLLEREQRKALFLLGPSRTGKTQVSTVAQRLIGDPIASPSVADIAERFGMQTMRGARAWIRDDAVSEQDKVDPARFKAIVTGEAVQVDLKQIVAARIPFAIPVVLTTNAMPRARDSSDAIYNRSLVIEMTNVVEEHEALPAREALGLPRGKSVGDAIMDLEGPGVLNWALDGLDRLRARGRYDPPATMREAVRRFKDDNNPVAAWISVAVERDSTSKVARNDLRCSFNGWQREEMGAEARAWGGRQFFPQVRQAAPWADMDGEQAHDGERFVTGLRLNATGLRFWDDHRLEPLGNGTKGYSSRENDVNRNHAVPERGGGARTEF